MGPPERKNRTWWEHYQALLTFKSKFGHTNVPISYSEDSKLAEFVKSQRNERGRAKLKEDQKAALDSIGFVWDPKAALWDERFQELKEFHGKNGSCKVPAKNRKLNTWIQGQRSVYRSGRMAEDRKCKLETLDFEWGEKGTTERGRKDNLWMQRYHQLVEYKRVHGHCNPPRKQEKLGRADSLSVWVSTQRTHHKQKKLPADRLKLLEQIGFVFNAQAGKYQESWSSSFEELKAFKKQTGHTRVPKRGSYEKLYAWVRHQRYLKRLNKLDPGCQALLNSIQFEWEGVKGQSEKQGDDSDSNNDEDASGNNNDENKESPVLEESARLKDDVVRERASIPLDDESQQTISGSFELIAPDIRRICNLIDQSEHGKKKLLEFMNLTSDFEKSLLDTGLSPPAKRQKTDAE
jgi:hypothetical protein